MRHCRTTSIQFQSRCWEFWRQFLFLVVRDKEEIEKQRIFMIEELWEVCRILILGSKHSSVFSGRIVAGMLFELPITDKGFIRFYTQVWWETVCPRDLFWDLYCFPFICSPCKYNISYHCHADDSQLYRPVRLDTSASFDVLLGCVDDIKRWMTNNFLQINEDKTCFNSELSIRFLSCSESQVRSSFNKCMQTNQKPWSDLWLFITFW